jgi:hypothetical protein
MEALAWNFSSWTSILVIIFPSAERKCWQQYFQSNFEMVVGRWEPGVWSRRSEASCSGASRQHDRRLPSRVQSRYFSEIRLYQNLNMAGRRFGHTHNFPVALWALVMARARNKIEACNGTASIDDATGYSSGQRYAYCQVADVFYRLLALFGMMSYWSSIEQLRPPIVQELPELISVD